MIKKYPSLTKFLLALLQVVIVILVGYYFESLSKRFVIYFYPIVLIVLQEIKNDIKR